MFINENELKFVATERKKGTSQKSGNDYDFATITVSDGLDSVDLSLRVDLHEYVQKNFARGQNVVIHIDAKRSGARTSFEVTKVEAA